MRSYLPWWRIYIKESILIILDSLVSNDIKKILYDYGYNLNMVRTGTPVRFSMHTLDSRFDRITKLLNEVEICEGMKIV